MFSFYRNSDERKKGECHCVLFHFCVVYKKEKSGSNFNNFKSTEIEKVLDMTGNVLVYF